MALEFLWQPEENFWTKEPSTSKPSFGGESWMVLPSPMDDLPRAGSLDALTDAERWSKITMSERHLVELSDDAAALVYSVTAERPGSDRKYHALCSSAYVRRGDAWLRVVHQQTPLA